MSSALLALLLRSEAFEATGSVLEKMRGMQGAMDSLLVEAERHGVLGRIWKRRGGQLRREFPTSIAARWRRAAYRLAARNLASCAELLRAVLCLRHAGIRSIPLKGPALGVAITGSFCTRDYVDLDLLIDVADSAHALEVLRTEGYRVAHQVGVNGAACDQVALSHPEGSMMLELQWDLGRRWNLYARAGEPPFPFEELWRRRSSVRICGVGTPSLAGPDQFLMLAVHGARHYWSKLLWVCDAADAVAAWPEMDWSLVLRGATQLRCVRRVCLTFHLISEVLGVQVPEAAWQRIRRDAQVPLLAGGIVRRWDEPDPPGWRRDLGDLGFTLASLDNWPSRLSLASRALRAWLRPNPRDYACLALPGWAAPAYYAIRPIRLAWRYGPQALQGCLGFTGSTEESSRDTSSQY